MMFKNIRKSFFITSLIALSFAVIFSFQNCTKTGFSSTGGETGEAGSSSTAPSTSEPPGTTPSPTGGRTAGVGSSETFPQMGSATSGAGNSTTGTPKYSEKCDDWQSVGWISKEACLKDGNWHTVYESGVPAYGDLDNFEMYMLGGADFKVVIPQQSLFLSGVKLPITINGNEECQSLYRSNRAGKPYYCLTSARFSGEKDGETVHSSTRFGTDGSLYCNGTRYPGQNGCTVDAVAYKWIVRF